MIKQLDPVQYQNAKCDSVTVDRFANVKLVEVDLTIDGPVVFIHDGERTVKVSLAELSFKTH